MSVYTGVIDDNDGTILFSSNWDLWQSNNPDPRNYKSTLHSTGIPGSFARVRFTGSRVAVVSTIATGNGALSRASFSLDNGPAIPVSVVTTPPVQFQYVFWDSGPLPFGSHLLVIVNLDNQAFFRIDHIDYDPTDSNSPKSSSAIPTLTRAVTVEQTATSTAVVATTARLVGPAETTSSGTDTSTESSLVASTTESATSSSASAHTGAVPTRSGQTSTSQSFSPPTDTNTSARGAPDNVANSRGSTSARGSMPVGAIVGGIAAAVLIVVALGVVLCFLKQRRGKKAIYLSEGRSPISVRNPTIPRPFIRRSHEGSASSLVGSRTHSINETSSLSDLIFPTTGHAGSSRGHKPQASTSSTANGARTKYAEFLAERQQITRIDTSCPPQVQGGFLSASLDVDAPPAYSGQMRASMGPGRRGFFS